MSHKFSNLFDEEKEELGDLPREMQSLMEPYLWHYRNDESCTVHEVEKTIEVPLPFLSAVTLKLRLDMPVADRKRVVAGKRVSVRVDLGGRRILKKQTTHNHTTPVHTHNQRI